MEFLVKKIRGTLRRIYLRSGILVAIRQRYLHWKFSPLAFVISLGNSRDNLWALQALTQNRFVGLKAVTHADVAVMNSWPLLTVSIVTFNSMRWLDGFFASLLIQQYPLSKIDLHFVDHGSTDDTISAIQRFLKHTEASFGAVTLVKQANLGFGGGHDRAIRECVSEYCFVTNVDIRFRPDTLCKIVKCALEDHKGLVASWEVRQAPYEHPKYYDPVTLETNWSSHACILVRRSAYLAVGGYEPRIFMYAEDVELSYRFRSYGYILKYVPSAVVEHFTYESAGQIKPLQYSGSIAGNLYLRFRYGENIDRFAGVLLYVSRYFSRPPFPGARSILAKRLSDVVKNLPYFLKGKGPKKAYFPFRGFDYEMVRDGAFWEIEAEQADNSIPLVTIVTRTYRGRGMFLGQAIQSVFNQTYSSIELLVVEDGGDYQQELVNTLAQSAPPGFHVRFLANAKLGRSAAGNAGLAAASGDLVMFLDDDDLLFADHVETLVSAMSKDDSLSAAYALAIEVLTRLEADKLTYSEEVFHTPDIFRQAWDYDVLLDHNFIPIQAILFKRKLYLERGGFDTALDQLEDWNLWLRYGYENRFAYIPKTTSIFRSPADIETRAARHSNLHAAYEEAKASATRHLEKLKKH